MRRAVSISTSVCPCRVCASQSRCSFCLRPQHVTPSARLLQFRTFSRQILRPRQSALFERIKEENERRRHVEALVGTASDRDNADAHPADADAVSVQPRPASSFVREGSVRPTEASERAPDTDQKRNQMHSSQKKSVWTDNWTGAEEMLEETDSEERSSDEETEGDGQRRRLRFQWRLREQERERKQKALKQMEEEDRALQQSAHRLSGVERDSKAQGAIGMREAQGAEGNIESSLHASSSSSSSSSPDSFSSSVSSSSVQRGDSSKVVPLCFDFLESRRRGAQGGGGLELLRGDQAGGTGAGGARGRAVGLSNEDPRVLRLSDEISALEARLTPPTYLVQEKNEFLQRLQATCSALFDSCVVSPFGSVVNGLWTPASDIDICLQVPGCATRVSQIKVLRRLASELQKVPTHMIEPRFSAKIPIIHWTPRERKMEALGQRRPLASLRGEGGDGEEGEGGGMIACDVSVNNVLAIVNSRLLGAYCKLDPRVRALGLALKHWAKGRGINDRSRGTLSSFALTLMLIHFLQHRPRPVLPSLQDIAIQKNHLPIYISGVDCRYSTSMKEIRQEMADALRGQPPNDESVGLLLVRFFRHFGFEYKSGVIAVRDVSAFLSSGGSALVTAREKERLREREREASGSSGEMEYLVVDNPFEVGKDVANVLAVHYAHIRTEFRRAAEMLHSGTSLEDVCGISSRGGRDNKQQAGERSPKPVARDGLIPRALQPYSGSAALSQSVSPSESTFSPGPSRTSVPFPAPSSGPAGESGRETRHRDAHSGASPQSPQSLNSPKQTGYHTVSPEGGQGGLQQPGTSPLFSDQFEDRQPAPSSRTSVRVPWRKGGPESPVAYGRPSPLDNSQKIENGRSELNTQYVRAL